ncbi:MAG: hypothetical protein ISP10_10050 [Aeromicrobium sp.]|jgi:hypothetical protein|nr:hypothetical protein [Aeromicrobium sp.]
MAKTIGSAADFYRLRMMRLDASDAVDFEWRDDILYRRPPADDIAEDEAYRAEAVLLDDEDVVITIATFDDPGAARGFLADAERDLLEMTKSEFEECYFPEPGSAL